MEKGTTEMGALNEPIGVRRTGKQSVALVRAILTWRDGRNKTIRATI
jgi:hypothetical protein